MNKISRVLCLAAAVTLIMPAAQAKTKSTPTPAPQRITETVQQDVPEKIRELLDLAYSEWSSLNGKSLPKSNKYTKWRNNYEWGWCAGFITWLMLQLDVPMERMADMEEEPLEGVIHVKEASVAKVMRGYMKAGRTTDVPQPGFLLVYGSTKNPASKTVHIGLVWDVQDLGNGKYRITTIEGNMSNTVRMYVHDYDLNASVKTKNLSAIPEEERTQEETKAFTYKLQSKNWYVNVFLMPWVPGETENEAPAAATEQSILTPLTPAPQ